MAQQDNADTGIAADKSKKYDRQLRLWGDHGQSALESAKVCLINATATGTEILKNLILPGVGSFTIVDGKKITGEDVGNNFFLSKDSIGKARSQVATELLLELNEDVNGDYVEDRAESVIENNLPFFKNFHLVIATALPERPLLSLAKVLWENDIPLIVCSSYGLMGYIRIVAKEHTVVESHPDAAHEDLRLDKPFPGLVSYCDSLDLSTMTKKDHMHTPWLVIIYKFLQQWKEQHAGAPPSNYREKNELKGHIRTGVRKNEDGVPEDEENFDEAITHLNPSLVASRIPSDVQSLFNDDSCINLHAESKPFWVLVRAVKEFVNNEGQGLLPVRGSIPDMTADSERYIALQNVYMEQANQDMGVVTQYVHQLLQNIGQEDLLNTEPSGHASPSRKCPDSITERDIKTFCKNAAFLRVVRTRSLAEEYNGETSKMSELAYHLEDEDSDLIYYVMLRAVDRFFSEYNRYPGYYQDSMEADVPKLKACVAKVLQDWGLACPVKDDFCQEFCRYGASELHSVASFMGGTVAQEAVKLLTSQYVPINNTYIYNAIKQTSLTVEL